MSSSTKRIVPDKDPYSVLGIEFGVSDADISKAYRLLARTLHPDKLVAQDLTPTQLTQAAARFQDIQSARSFLLDADHAESRRKYDAQRASDQIRQAANKERDASMSERRKRMRAELTQREDQATMNIRRDKNLKTHRQKHQSSATSKTRSPASAALGDLERQGQALREHYADQAVAAELRKQDEAALLLQERQIRLKWSRKKIKAAGDSSPSEDSIASMLSAKFGAVDAVQMIGDKGNVALVTFHAESSCTKAVNALLTSDTWRATYVSKTKQQISEQAASSASKPNNMAHEHARRNHETIDEWKARQAMEREALLRQMECNEEDDDQTTPNDATNDGRSPRRPFPPSFPEEYNAWALALDKLERAEDTLLEGIFSKEMLQQIKVVR
jgi:curved DNA-binding protein CbpA